MKEFSKYKGKGNLVVWDSHMNFINEWKSICLESEPEDFTAQEKREWRCDDWLHPGPVVTDHLADMLLNFLCGQWCWTSVQIEWFSSSLHEKMSIIKLSQWLSIFVHGPENGLKPLFMKFFCLRRSLPQAYKTLFRTFSQVQKEAKITNKLKKCWNTKLIGMINKVCWPIVQLITLIN